MAQKPKTSKSRGHTRVDLAKFVAHQIGQRIRQARRQKKMTLEVLGREAALSPAFLSRVEQGKATPSIANLIVMSECLGMPLRDVFEDHGAMAAAAPAYTLSKARERRKSTAFKSGGYAFTRLCGDLPNPLMNAFELEFPANHGRNQELLVHEGEEVLFVLEGKIEFQIGPDKLVMQAGDCVHFNCGKPHLGRNIGTGRARMLMIVSPSGSAAERFKPDS